ncbi:MAG: outer membrane protein assembly factor BamA [Sedimentisphaerales bacterium]|nr:outer membrane protein assembly factor BamA [Sedimentisphaerales bacterium]
MVVGSIEVAGNQNATAAQIFAKTRIRQGDMFSEETAAQDAKRIAELSAIDYAYFNKAIVDGRIKLTYVVVEKILVRAIKFIGDKEFWKSTLKNKLDFKRGDYLNRFLVETGKDNLLKLYNEKGYPFTKIEIDPQDLAVGIVTYTIDEGPRVKVKDITFVGNRDLKSGELSDFVKTSTREWLVFQGYYEEKVMSEDVIKLQNVYQKTGHLDAQVAAAPEFTADKKAAVVVFTIGEGPIYRVESVKIVGNTFFDSSTLMADLKLAPGAFFSYERADFDSKKILARYRETGFIDATVTSKRNFIPDNKVAAEFEVVEGERFRIGQIAITGNEQTHDKVVRRILDEKEFIPGNWYNADIARGDGSGELEKALKQNAMMESAFIKPTGQTPGQKDAQVSVTEGQTGMVMLGAGVSSDAGVVGQIVFEQRNFDISDWPTDWSDFFHGTAFKGAGQRMRIALEPGTQVSQYSVTFTEPYLMDKPISMDITGAYWTRGQEGYDETRTRGSVSFDRRYKEGWRQGVGFRVENVLIDDVDDDAPMEVKEFEGGNFLTGVKYSFGRDTTDNRFNPTKGYLWNVGFEPVYSDELFGIATATHRWYKTINEDLAERKTILGTKLHFGQIIGDAPMYEKFYAGGTQSMRGFEYRGVSTRGFPTVPNTMTENKNGKKKDPIGSSWIFLAGSEVAVPLASDMFQGLLFVDSGAVDTGGYRVAVGTGIQILLPQWFGPVPMRFEFSVPVMKSSEDQTQVFSFSVGRLF